MQDYRLPKQCLFGWLPKTRPSGGPRRRWRDLAKKDLTAVKVGEDWYSLAQDRKEWSTAWSQSLAEHKQTQQTRGPRGEKIVLCRECGGQFMKEGDKARHKCAVERRRSVCEQAGPCSAKAVIGSFGAVVA